MNNSITIRQATFNGQPSNLQPYHLKLARLLSYHSGIDTDFILECLKESPNTPFIYEFKN